MDCGKPMNSLISKYLKADEASKGAVRVEIENGLAIAVANVLYQLFSGKSLNNVDCNMGTLLNIRIVESVIINNNSVAILGALVL